MKLTKKEKQEIEKIEKNIKAIFDTGDTYENCWRVTNHDRDEIERIKQGPADRLINRWGLEVPKEMLQENGRLAYGADLWVAREAAKAQLSWAKDWLP